MRSLILFSENFGRTGQWLKGKFRLALSWMLHLPAFYKRPVILSFGPQDKLIIQGGMLVLEWQVRHAWKVKIGGVGSFSFETRAALNPEFDNRQFVLTAYGYGRKAKVFIAIQTLPPLDMQKRVLILSGTGVKTFFDKVILKRDGLPVATSRKEIVSVRSNLQVVPRKDMRIMLPSFENHIESVNN